LAISAGATSFAQINSNLIACQGIQGHLVNRCHLAQETVLARAQPYESEFRVDYRMTCNRNYRGPKASFTSVFLENGQALNLQYNYEGSNLLVGTGIGPLVLRDVKPVDLANMQFNECQLVFTNVKVQYSPTVSARIDFLKQRIAEIDQLLPILDGGLTSFKMNIELFSQVSKLSKAFAESARGLRKAKELGEIAAMVDSAVDQAIDKSTNAETVDGELISSLMDLSKLMTKVSTIVQVTGDEFPVDRIVTSEELQAIDASIIDVEMTIENLGKLTFDSSRKITDLQEERAQLERERLNY
jgi:hypothetical protein